MNANRAQNIQKQNKAEERKMEKKAKSQYRNQRPPLPKNNMGMPKSDENHTEVKNHPRNLNIKRKRGNNEYYTDTNKAKNDKNLKINNQNTKIPRLGSISASK